MRLSIFILALLVLAPIRATAGELALLTHDLGVQAYIDPASGELRGRDHAGKRSFNLEVVRALKHMLGLETPIREVLYADGIRRLDEGGDAAFFNVYRTPQREHLYKWVGPLQREVDYLYGLNGTLSLKSLEDARGVAAICVVSDSMHHAVLNKKGFTNVRTEATYAICFDQLKRGEATLAVSSDETVAQKLAASNIPISAVHRIPEPVVESAGYIAFSKRVNDKVIQRWQEAFNALVGSGLYQDLYDRYYIR
jgi:polar amino acid transport system substrate-binding protein